MKAILGMLCKDKGHVVVFLLLNSSISYNKNPILHLQIFNKSVLIYM
jgi:hypothetical protein